MRANKVITNLVGGELSPLIHGRIDLPVYQKGLSRCENFVALPQGGARYRSGTSFVKQTRLNKKAIFIPFQFNDEQAYLIEATDQRFRFYKDESAILEAPFTVTGVTNANPGVFTTSAAHGLVVGNEVFIGSVGGVQHVNNRFFLINTVPTTTTFTLKTIEGTIVDTTTWGAYTSGGSVSRVYEVWTPYIEAHLTELQWAQNADTMYIAHRNYEPRKLTRAGHANWTLATYTRINDPFTPLHTETINNATAANPSVLTSTTSVGFAVGDTIEIQATLENTVWDQLNTSWVINSVAGSTFTIKNPVTGVVFSAAGFPAFGANKASKSASKYPRAVTFIDSARLMFGGTLKNPESVWASRAPSTGNVAFDDFTTGTLDTDAIIFTLAPIHGRVDAIEWLANTSKFIVIGTFGAIRRLYGSVEAEPISPTSVTAKSVVGYGCSTTLPVSTGNSLFFIQRGGRFLRSLEYDMAADAYVTTDRNLVSEHLTAPGIFKIVEQQGQPDVVWAIRNDGRLLGLTFKEKEDISGWHQHYIGGSHVNDNGVTMPFGRVLAAGRMIRPAGGDQLWLVVERIIGVNTVRSVEFVTDPVLYPLRNSFYTKVLTTDKAKYQNALYEAQKGACNLDMSLAYDGADPGNIGSITLTPAAISGTNISVTASASFFTAASVGQQLWKIYDENGDGGGRITITTFDSATQIHGNITVPFDNTNPIPPGKWRVTTTSITGLEYLEGQTISVVADGGPVNNEIVVNGAISLDQPATTVIIGMPYRGRLSWLNVDIGGALGSAADKVKNLVKAVFRFINAGGVQFGADPYRLERIVFKSTADLLNRPVPLFTGIKELLYGDRWDADKELTLLQELPVPCTLTSVDFYMDTTDE